MFKYKTMTIALFLVTFLTASFIRVFAVNGDTILYISGTETITVGSLALPWPIDDYTIDLYAIPSFEGSNEVSWNVDKNFISPGESVSMDVDLGQGEHHYRMDFNIVVTDKSTDNAILDKTAGIDLGTLNVPGIWSSPEMAVPIIPFEIVGIPIELSVYFYFSLSSEYSLKYTTFGLTPQTANLEYSSGMIKTTDFSKPSGVGADITLSSAQVQVEGSIVVSAGLSVGGIPTPLKKDFASVPIGGWVTSHDEEISMATLKTPITIEVSVNKEVITLSDEVVVSGRVVPQASGLTMQIIVANTMVGTTVTEADGSYNFNWQPTHTGTFALFSKCEATEYTTTTSSPTINIEVKETSNTLTDIMYRYRLVILFIGGAIFLVAVMLLTRKRHIPRPRGTLK